jgi:BetI-type transcriptional repressor, C-terminal
VPARRRRQTGQLPFGVEPAEPRVASSLLSRNDETGVAHAERREDAPLEDLAERCFFETRDEEAEQVGRQSVMKASPRLIDQRQRAESCDPLIRAEGVVDLPEATLDVIPERTTAAVGRLTGVAYTLTSPDLRARVREITAGSYELGAEWLRTLGDERELPMPAEHLVCVIHALIEGLVLQRILTPELCPDEVFFAAFGALAHHRGEPNLNATPVAGEPSAAKDPA